MDLGTQNPTIWVLGPSGKILNPKPKSIQNPKTFPLNHKFEGVHARLEALGRRDLQRPPA